ncbi:MAG: hypothetical protein K2V38_09905 [Gemmataceae bacterium]|nr:hypothetical protein [Gemmataceae bacterium]
MFHDDRTWCVRPEGTPEAVASQLTRRTWPACTAFTVGGYLFLNDSLPEDGSAVWLNETETGPRYNVQISRLYKDKNDKWKDSSSFGREDLPLVGKVADQAMVWIYENPAAAEK